MKQDVGGFDVAMHAARPVEKVQAVDQVGRELGPLFHPDDRVEHGSCGKVEPSGGGGGLGVVFQVERNRCQDEAMLVLVVAVKRNEVTGGPRVRMQKCQDAGLFFQNCVRIPARWRFDGQDAIHTSLGRALLGRCRRGHHRSGGVAAGGFHGTIHNAPYAATVFLKAGRRGAQQLISSRACSRHRFIPLQRFLRGGALGMPHRICHVDVGEGRPEVILLFGHSNQCRSIGTPRRSPALWLRHQR